LEVRARERNDSGADRFFLGGIGAVERHRDRGVNE
jgi:hypothetical protein